MKIFLCKVNWVKFLNIFGWFLYGFGLVCLLSHLICGLSLPPYLVGGFLCFMAPVVWTFSNIVDLYMRVKKLESTDQEAN